jgi:hypothetical protein
MVDMIYAFSWGWFFIGLIVLAISVALTVWYRVVADNFGNGVSSYEQYRLWGLIGCGLGFVVMVNLHTYVLGLFFSQLFG